MQRKPKWYEINLFYFLNFRTPNLPPVRPCTPSNLNISQLKIERSYSAIDKKSKWNTKRYWFSNQGVKENIAFVTEKNIPIHLKHSYIMYNCFICKFSSFVFSTNNNNDKIKYTFLHLFSWYLNVRRLLGKLPWITCLVGLIIPIIS